MLERLANIWLALNSYILSPRHVGLSNIVRVPKIGSNGAREPPTADLTGYKNDPEALDENPSMEVNKVSKLLEGEVATCSASKITTSEKGVFAS